MSAYTEDLLVEQPAIQLMEQELGWEAVNAFGEWAAGTSSLGREAKREVVLVARLRPVLEKLNPELPAEAVDAAVEELTRDRSALSLVEGNREIDKLLRGGVKVTIPDREVGGQRVEVVRVFDWDEAATNDFLLVSQFWISGDLYTRRPDLIGFVNGLPLVLIELKKPGVNVREAFDKNLADYKGAIPQLFHYNGFLLVSNGVQSKIGSLTAEWEHFGDWKKVAEEEEVPDISLKTLLRGTCEKSRLLDLVENFTRFSENKGAVGKLVARNHQFLGVNRAVEALRTTEDGRVGVFWHTQGSGKSYSMVFFAEKVFRKLAGNWTFVVITDRTELDTQIYRTFSTCGAASELCQATSASHLRKLLGEDHRYVFTLIHKFRTDLGTLHPVLSERDDIIVLTDEAHRSQYDTLAMNMRTALPNAKFVAFTGTPLIAGEERTREVFGDYVSIYDFKQSVEDGATVPLYYENRTPELEITNPELNEEIYQVIDEAALDDEQEEKLKKVLGQRYHLITREERLDAVAKDIVHHFLNRGYQGKAMVVSIDKLTTLKMFEKVKAEWETETERVSKRLAALSPLLPEHRQLNERLRNLQETDMAVVVSSGQNEIAEMKDKGFDILPHRERMVKEDLETKFKDPDDQFRLVFVCAMWLTGFDAPSCSTLYLDKPMRGHTLMQTIARANRVHGEKVNGLIVDYANVFTELEKALAIYGSGSGGGELPVKDKTELIEALRIALVQVRDFCRKQNVDLEAIVRDSVSHFVPAVNQLLRTDPVKEEFLAHDRDIQRLYKAVMPDPIIPTLTPLCQVIDQLAKAIRAQGDPVDISTVMADISQVLDESIVADSPVVAGAKAAVVDLSNIDFGALEKKFAKSKTKNTEAQKLRALIERKLDKMIRLNASRYDFLDRFQKMVEQYNSGALSIEQLFEELLNLSQDLNEEEQRHVRENVNEEQLAIFDILTRPGPELDPSEAAAIKKVCKELLGKLKTELLVLAWRNKRTTRAAVRIEIEKMLDAGLPEKYTAELFEQKCGMLFQHVLEKYPDEGESIYNKAG
ncbi:type I restriction endonuclease subunit R [Roseibacillus persicicus]|uniref:type I restriction endonuclease subunit R n=1 Tax=Roseibacillus persicicus TaxID=454148 RepID=UPI00280D9D7A|nr:type I restriction endonuclease subunit R [Roseibacillus persicicus]MDQ8192010.1 type I restriction endonuclease subunit R [Roseibacillus persicicus]